MLDYIISDILTKIFPVAWPFVSLLIFSRTIYKTVHEKYVEYGLYEVCFDLYTANIAIVSTMLYVIISVYDPTALCAKFATYIAGNSMFNQSLIGILSYGMRCLYAAIVARIIGTVAWQTYLRHYIARSIYA